jgi:hypothetical protein
MSSESSILREFAEALAESLTKQVIRRLQQLKNSTLSAEDSGLKNPWDEICVQVQSEHSHAWRAYLQTSRGVIRTAVRRLAPHEQYALWLQTESGIVRSEDQQEDGAVDFENESEIVEYLLEQYLLPAAEDWSNARIRSFLESGEGIA